MSVTSGVARWAIVGSDAHHSLVSDGWQEAYRKPVYETDEAALMVMEDDSE